MIKRKSDAEAIANSRIHEEYTKVRNKMQDGTHVARLFDYMYFVGDITPMECFEKLGNTRISSTVYCLRRNYGLPIRTKMVVKNGKSFGAYGIDWEVF